MSEKNAYNVGDIEKRMRLLVDEGWDGEIDENHKEADAMLLEIVRFHAPNVADLFERVEKWYS